MTLTIASSTVPLITFYIPPELWPENIPKSADENWAGYGLGVYAWTVQTYLKLTEQLTEIGVTCQLTCRLPAEGIVFVHSNALRSISNLKPSSKRLLICIKAEAPLNELAQIHIVQNPTEAFTGSNCYYLPHWPQPQLIPRKVSRGDRLETIAFFGHKNNLAKELRSDAWQTALAQRGLSSLVVANTNHWTQYNTLDTRWNNYYNVDAIVAVRSFDPAQRWLSRGYASKPATKLYNAWLAGAIPILGVESAYRNVGQRGEDYIEVASFRDLLGQLDRLKADVALGRSLREKGQVRSQGYTADKIARCWQVFLETIAIPTYARWRHSSAYRRRYSLLQAKYLSYLDRSKRRGQQVLLNSLVRSA